MEKAITIFVLGQLIDEGKLALSDDVSTHLGYNVRNPNYPDVNITVQHLIDMTSSIYAPGVMVLQLWNYLGVPGIGSLWDAYTGPHRAAIEIPRMKDETVKAHEYRQKLYLTSIPFYGFKTFPTDDDLAAVKNAGMMSSEITNYDETEPPLIDKWLQKPDAFRNTEPGQAYYYSDISYNLLVRMVEKIDGSSWNDSRISRSTKAGLAGCNVLVCLSIAEHLIRQYGELCRGCP